MTDEMNRSAFDKLVAGMDAVERSDMLEKINQSSVSVVQLVETENQLPEKNVSLHIRFRGESALYRFLLWLRGLLEKKDPEKITSLPYKYTLDNAKDVPAIVQREAGPHNLK